MQKIPKVLICVLNWNNLSDTLQCLQSIFCSNYPEFSVLVVDNNSKDKPADSISNLYPQVKMISNSTNLGYTGGNNQGLRMAASQNFDYIWLLNSDCTIESNTLTELINAAVQDPSVGLLSPVIYYHDHPNRILYCGSVFDLKNQKKSFTRDLNQLEEWQYKIPEKICLWGTALLIKAALIHDVGLLDEIFFAYDEDIDYSIRSAQAGYRRLIIPVARVFHKKSLYKSEEIQYPLHYYFYSSRNEYFLWKKHIEASQRKKYSPKYIRFALQFSANCKEKGGIPEAQACLDGMWSAFRNKTGSFENRACMPRWLSALILWHPFLLIKIINLLDTQLASLSES